MNSGKEFDNTVCHIERLKNSIPKLGEISFRGSVAAVEITQLIMVNQFFNTLST